LASDWPPPVGSAYQALASSEATAAVPANNGQE
jgi:hypothetical protein